MPEPSNVCGIVFRNQVLHLFKPWTHWCFAGDNFLESEINVARCIFKEVEEGIVEICNWFCHFLLTALVLVQDLFVHKPSYVCSNTWTLLQNSFLYKRRDVGITGCRDQTQHWLICNWIHTTTDYICIVLTPLRTSNHLCALGIMGWS